MANYLDEHGVSLRGYIDSSVPNSYRLRLVQQMVFDEVLSTLRLRAMIEEENRT